MRKTIRSSLLFFLVIGGIGGAAAQSTSNQPRTSGMETDTAKIKEAMLGDWESIAPEVRPSKNPDGSLKPFYLKRAVATIRALSQRPGSWNHALLRFAVHRQS